LRAPARPARRPRRVAGLHRLRSRRQASALFGESAARGSRVPAVAPARRAAIRPARPLAAARRKCLPPTLLPPRAHANSEHSLVRSLSPDGVGVDPRYDSSDEWTSRGNRFRRLKPRANLNVNRAPCERCAHRLDLQVDRDGVLVCVVCNREPDAGPCSKNFGDYGKEQR
jgi:hypothetical protein